MKTIIHDLDNLDFLNLSSEYKVFTDNKTKECQGCFLCWVKTPMECALKDNISNIGEDILNSDELIIISKCVNGCYSSKVKKILERCISYVEAFFTLREGEIHHIPREKEKMKFKVYFYGDISDINRKTALKLVNANRKNLNTETELYFINDYKEILL